MGPYSSRQCISTAYANSLMCCHARYSVVVTARSPEKGNGIIQSLDEEQRPHVSFEIVKDVAAEGAFDEVSWTVHSSIVTSESVV